MRPFTSIKLKHDKPFLLIGKGPSFSKIWDVNLTKYYTLGINHVNEIFKCTIALAIDIDVLDYSFIRSEHVVLPWHPHYLYRPTNDTLEEWAKRNPYLQEAEELNKLYYYNLSTWKGKHKEGCLLIKTRFFSAEAAFRVLIALGIKEINSLGIDGGTKYASEFKHLTPLQNGRNNFDDQFVEINKIIEESGIIYKAL